MTFRESLARARSQQFCVWRWGPFVVTPEGYRAAKQAYLCLEEGERFQTIRYQALDRASRYRHPTAINCIHVLTDIARPGVRTGTLRGISASQVVVNEFRRAGMFGDIDRSVAWIWENDGIIP